MPAADPLHHANLVETKRHARIVHSPEVIQSALKRLSQRISADYRGKCPVLLVVMNGGLVFSGQLLPLLDFPAEMDYCHATRYRGETEGSDLQWQAMPQAALADRHVLILDDILDEGFTLASIVAACEGAGAASVKTAVLIEKKHDRKAVPGMTADYCELVGPDEYLFGFGMDYRHYWRNTDAIYALIP